MTKAHIVSYAVLAALATPAFGEALTDASPVETVVVTAQKREQNPIAVPFALTAYSGDFLKGARLQSFDTLSLYVPGFEVQNQSPNNPGFVMRGITSDSNDSTQEPRVSVFEDGVSASQPRGSYFELFDIARIEVAKGPQSTLFGRSALIGGVNVITNKANPDGFEADGAAEFGDYGYRMVEGALNVPVSDTLAVRASGRYKARDGYVKNLLGGDDFNSVDTWAARLSAAWTPNKKFSADVIFNIERDTPSGTSFKSGSIVPTDPATGAVLGSASPYEGAALASVPGFEGGRDLGLRRNLYSATAILSYALAPAYTLTSQSAYRRYESEEVFDADGSSLPLAAVAEDARGDQFSQEFRLNFDDGGRVSWFAGTTYFYENNSSRIPMQFSEPILLAQLSGQLDKANPPPTAFFSSPLFGLGYAPLILQGMAGQYGIALDSTVASGLGANLSPTHWEQYETYGKTKSVDLYGDVTVRLTEALELEAGLRYTHDDKQSAYAGTVGSRSVLGGIIGALSQPAAVRDALLGALSQSYEAQIPADQLPYFGLETQPTANDGAKVGKAYHDNGLTWRATARYALSDNDSLYAVYGRGRRPKVLSATSPAAPYADPTFTAVAAETVDSYEVGYKTLALDGRLRFDVAFYLYNYDNFQTTILKNTAQVAANAGKANAYGTELSLDAALASWADFFGTYTYGHARFGGDSLFKHNQFRLTPDHKLSMGLNLRRNLLGGTVTLTPTYTWQSKIYFDDDNDIAGEQTSHLVADAARDEVQGDYGLAGLRLSYQPESQPWTVGFFVTNLFNRKYLKDAGNIGDYFGLPTFIRGEPRFVGMNVGVKIK